MARYRSSYRGRISLRVVNHKDSAFLALKALLEPFGISQFYTDG